MKFCGGFYTVLSEANWYDKHLLARQRVLLQFCAAPIRLFLACSVADFTLFSV